MARGPWETKLWCDIKLSNGKTPKQIVRTITKELDVLDRNVDEILTRFLSLKDKNFFKKGVPVTNALLASTYLYLSSYMLSKDPLSPWKFMKVCKKKKFNISYSLLMKHVRKAKKAGLFGPGPRSNKLVKRYRRRMGTLFHLDKATLDEISALVDTEGTSRKVGGTSPFAVVAGLTYICTGTRKLYVTQKELCSFFGVSVVTIRNFTSGKWS